MREPLPKPPDDYRSAGSADEIYARAAACLGIPLKRYLQTRGRDKAAAARVIARYHNHRRLTGRPPGT